MILSAAAFASLAVACQVAAFGHQLVSTADLQAIAAQESGFNTAATHVNNDGSIDWGLMGINEGNFRWLRLTRQTAVQPCPSIVAAVTHLTATSIYNTGSPTKGFRNGYVATVMHRIQVAQAGLPAPTPQYRPPPQAPPASIFSHPSPKRHLVFSANN